MYDIQIHMSIFVSCLLILLPVMNCSVHLQGPVPITHHGKMTSQMLTLQNSFSERCAGDKHTPESATRFVPITIL